MFHLKHIVTFHTFWSLYNNYRICQLNFQSSIFIFCLKLIKSLLNVTNFGRQANGGRRRPLFLPFPLWLRYWMSLEFMSLFSMVYNLYG